MPRFPHFNPRIKDLPGSVYEKYVGSLKKAGPDLIKLHIGDTCLHPPYSLPITDHFVDTHKSFNRYCNTYGIDSLRRALADKLTTDNALKVDRDQVLVTNGATNALSLACSSLLTAGEEVLVLTPAWPFFVGMVRVAGCSPIQIPVYVKLYEGNGFDLGQAILDKITEKTVALYLNTPNNPSGKVLDSNQLEIIADIAKAHNLWIISDEAYDGMTFDGREHVSIGSMPGMFDRTLSIFTFSKIFMVAGFRLGYVAAPEAVIQILNKAMVHQIYSPSTVLQYFMIEALESRHSWMKNTLETYEKIRDKACQALEVTVNAPEGTYFIFLDTSQHVSPDEYWRLIEHCVSQGVAIAPGADFGDDFGRYIRICFTGEPAEKVMKGIEIINALLR